MPKRAFDDNNGIPPWVTASPTPIRARLGKPEPAFPAREGVLWQPCPTCGAEPGEACMRPATGETLHNFHADRPDGYDD